MLVEDKDFFTEFKKRFSNFCDNLPFLFSFYLSGTVVVLKDKSPLIPSSLNFPLDMNVSASDNISIIKEQLYKYLPVFYLYEEETLGEIQEKIEKGLVTSYDYEPEVKKIRVYTLEKINNKKNQILVFNHKKNKKEILTLKTPVIIFLNKTYEKEERKSTEIDNIVLNRKELGG